MIILDNLSNGRVEMMDAILEFPLVKTLNLLAFYKDKAKKTTIEYEQIRRANG